MSSKMDYEIEKTISRLKASIPEQRQKSSLGVLLRLAASEMNMILLGMMLIAILFIGALLSANLSAPMLTCFCTAPMPVLLLFHQYVLRDNERMKELEQTFKYSYAEMLSARAIVIFVYMLVSLICLSATIHYVAGESFLRLALCGATPGILLCALLLWVSHNLRKQGNIALIAIVFWLFLCFATMVLPFGVVLQAAQTGLYALFVAVGIILFSVCLHHIRTGGPVYAASTR
jgi:hypothetical protein